MLPSAASQPAPAALPGPTSQPAPAALPGPTSQPAPAALPGPALLPAEAAEAAEDFADQVQAAFEDVYRRSFRGDPAANPRLRVETVAPALVLDTITVVLVTPWTLNGLFCPPPSAVAPDWLEVSGRPRRVFAGKLDGVGRYLSVHLLPDVSHLQSPQQVRKMAAAFAGPFGTAVRQWRTADR